jgi:integrase
VRSDRFGGNSHGAADITASLRLAQLTQRPIQFEITAPTREAVAAWIKEAGLHSEDYLFPSRIHGSPHIGTRQYARILHAWASDIGDQEPTSVQILLGHTKLESTVRYLDVEVDDAFDLAEQLEM